MMRNAILIVPGLAILFPAGPVEAQSPPMSYGIGIVANAPRQFTGLGVHFLLPGLRGFGLYLDAKFDPLSDTRDGVLLAYTRAEAEALGDQWFGDEERWTTFNAALLYEVTDELRLYAGVGPSRQEGFTRYWDEVGERGELGYYWIENPDRTGTQINLLGGAFFRIARGFFVQFGLESQPQGYTLGLTLSLPRR